MSSPPEVSPVNPLPPVVVALFLFILGVEAVFNLGARGLIGGPGAVGWRLSAVQSYAFSGDIFDWMVQNQRYPAQHMIRFVSYPFVHGNFTQALFAGVILLAMGKMVGEVMSQLSVLAIFLIAGIVGALAFAVLTNDPAPLIAAFPPVYGLIGAFTYLLWLRLGELGANQVRAFSLIGVLMGIQLVFGLIFGAQNDWIADIAGFATGFLLSPFLTPGGWGRFRSRIRHD